MISGHNPLQTQHTRVRHPPRPPLRTRRPVTGRHPPPPPPFSAATDPLSTRVPSRIHAFSTEPFNEAAFFSLSSPPSHNPFSLLLRVTPPPPPPPFSSARFATLLLTKKTASDPVLLVAIPAPPLAFLPIFTPLSLICLPSLACGSPDTVRSYAHRWRAPVEEKVAQTGRKLCLKMEELRVFRGGGEGWTHASETLRPCNVWACVFSLSSKDDAVVVLG